MKKNILFLFLLFSCFNSYSQIIIDSISKFETTNYDKINLPIIKAKSSLGNVYFLIDCGSNLSIFDISYYNKYACYTRSYQGDKFEYTSINSTIQISYNVVRVTINDVSYKFIHTSLYGLNEAIKEYKIVGILGNDWLKLNKAVINYNDRTLRITPLN
jgi:hypothetical protein